MDLNFQNLILEVSKFSYLKKIDFDYDLKEYEMVEESKLYNKSETFTLDNGYLESYYYGEDLAKNWEKLSILFSKGGYQTFMNDLIHLGGINKWELPIVGKEKNLIIELKENGLFSVISQKEGDDWRVEFTRWKNNINDISKKPSK